MFCKNLWNTVKKSVCQASPEKAQSVCNETYLAVLDILHLAAGSLDSHLHNLAHWIRSQVGPREDLLEVGSCFLPDPNYQEGQTEEDLPPSYVQVDHVHAPFLHHRHHHHDPGGALHVYIQSMGKKKEQC